ncbi:MAG: SsrA-binding protein SmpB [Planctomycetota bacterium]|nr:MAG: SsrA-binding protein SmpB [Planctomycetota bacterium]
MAKKTGKTQPRIINKKARHNYHILKTIEAGIVLTGSEVKSLRGGNAQITEAFVRINGYKATLYGCQIDRYTPATDRNHDPQRSRRLLLHRQEIKKITPQIAQAGVTLIPLSIYFNQRGLVKVELALATGKKSYDKRQELRKRDHKREMQRALNRRQR